MLPLSSLEMSATLDPNDFVAAQISVQLSKCSLADAIVHSLRKAHKKHYPVLTCDPGYNHRLTLCALGFRERKCGNDISLYLTGEKERLCFQCNGKILDGQVLSRGQVYRQEGDESVLVQLLHSFKKPLICSSGQYKLVVLNKDDGLGQLVQSQGVYDLSQFVGTDRGYHLVRIPLHRTEQLQQCVEKRLPCQELRLVCKRSRKQPGCFKIRSVHLALQLRPSAQWLLDQRTCIPVGPRRCPVDPAPLCTQYQGADEQRLCEPINQATGLSACLEKQLQLSLGSQAQFRLVAHLGRQQLCQAGSADFHYRLSSCTEPLTAIAVVHYVQQNAPKDWPVVDIHSSKLLKHFLKCAGAGLLYKGLKSAYKCHGYGRVPSIYELLNHTSGLPEHEPLSCDPVPCLIQNTAPEALTLGDRLARHMVPQCCPGSKYHHSHLGYQILRSIFPGDGGYQLAVKQVLAELGAPTACFESQQARLAPACGAHVPSMQGYEFLDPQASSYAASTGLLARIDEIAAVLSERNAWRQCSDASTYSFLSHLLLPRVTVHRSSGTCASYGWNHVSLPVPAYNNELRAAFRVGSTRGQHNVVLAIVPALGLSLALGTNADISALAPAPSCSIVATLGALVQTICNSLVSLENHQLQPALVFNPVCNAQLSVAPDCCPAYPAFVRYCSSAKRQLCNDPTLLALNKCGRLVSLLDMRHVPANNKNLASPVQLEVAFHKEKALLIEHFADGDGRIFELQYDPNMYCSNAAALKAFQGVSKGLALDKSQCGQYRLVCPQDGLLTEAVRITSDEASGPRVYLKVLCLP